MVSFLLLNAGALLVAFVLAVALGLRGRPSLLLLRTLCGYLVVVHSITLLTGLAGYLTVGGSAILLTAAIIGALGVGYRMRDEMARKISDEGDRGAERGTCFTAAALFAPLAALASAIVWAWPHVSGATRLWVWDDYTYHMVYPTVWLREQAIAAATPAGAFTMQAWYPLSASVVATWFMLPFHGERGEALAWVGLTGVLYAGIVGSGAAELLARLGCRPGAWAVPVVLFATSHRTAIMASSFSDADLAQAASLFAAFVFALPPGDASRRRDGVTADAWYAALLTGIALGVKVSAAPAAVIILLVMILRAGRPFAMRVILAFAVAWAATSGYWYARNAVHMGNPLYPAAFLAWPGTTFPETTLLEYSRQYGVRRTLADALVIYMNWPRLHAALALAGLLSLAGWAGVHRRSGTRSQRYFAGGALATAVAILIVLPTAPYSAGNAMTFRSGFVHWDSMRYVALLPLLGWVALGFTVDGGAGAGRWRSLAAVSITSAGLLTSGDAWLASPLVLLGLAVGAAVLARARLPVEVWRPFTIRRAALAAGTIALVVAGIAAWSHAGKATATAAAFHREPLFGKAAAILDRQPDGMRGAVFGDQWVYPAFGARTHLRPVRLDRDGRVATAPIGDAMEPGDLTVDPATFRSNLRASGVGLVVVVHLEHPGRAAEWPTQQAALERMADARVLYRDGSVAIWQLGP